MCPAGMLLPMLLQICKHNFLDNVEVSMGAVKAHTWKKFVKQAEIAEKSAKKFESPTPKSMRGINNKGHDMAESSDTDTLTVGVSRTKEYQRQYSFKDKNVVTLLHLLKSANKLKLPEARRPDEVG